MKQSDLIWLLAIGAVLWFIFTRGPRERTGELVEPMVEPESSVF